MDPELKTIVQRMIDAGESEENIGAVIQYHEAQKKTGPKPVSANEPDTYLGGMVNELVGKPALERAKNFAGGVKDSVTNLPETLFSGVKGALDVGQGVLNFANDPVNVGKAGLEGMKSVPENAVQMAKSAYDMAVHDPNAFARGVGNVTGNALMSTAVMGVPGQPGLISYLPKSVVAPIGAGLESVGGKGGTLAFRVAGLHQLSGGNPLGLATLMLPEAFRKSGQTLQRWATEPGALAATPEGMFLQVQQDLRKAASDPKLAATLSDQLDKLSAQAEQLRMNAKLPSDLAAAQKMSDRVDKLTASLARTTAPAKSAAAAEAENAANLQRIKDARAGLEPTAPNIRESVSATDPTGAKQSMSRTFRPPVDESGLTPGELAQIQRQVTDPELQAQVIAQFKAQKAGTATVVQPQPAVRPPVRIVGGPMQPPPEAAGAAPAPTGPVAPPAPPVAPEPNVAPIRVAADKVATNARELATKSKRGIPSGTPGYTVNDLESVGLNPKLNYKALTQDIIDKILENRAARQETYRINEGLNTGGTNAAAREPMTLQEQLEASLRARQGEQ